DDDGAATAVADAVEKFDYRRYDGRTELPERYYSKIVASLLVPKVRPCVFFLMHSIELLYLPGGRMGTPTHCSVKQILALFQQCARPKDTGKEDDVPLEGLREDTCAKEHTMEQTKA